jgi:hypothetical protein
MAKKTLPCASTVTGPISLGTWKTVVMRPAESMRRKRWSLVTYTSPVGDTAIPKGLPMSACVARPPSPDVPGPPRPANVVALPVAVSIRAMRLPPPSAMSSEPSGRAMIPAGVLRMIGSSTGVGVRATTAPSRYECPGSRAASIHRPASGRTIRAE